MGTEKNNHRFEKAYLFPSLLQYYDVNKTINIDVE